MTHPDDAILQQWSDGELAPGTRHDEVAVHLEACARCRAVVAGLGGLQRAVRTWADEVPLPAGNLADAVLRQAGPPAPERQAQVVSLRRVAYPLLAVAAALVIWLGPRVTPTRTPARVVAPPDSGLVQSGPEVTGAEVVRVDVVGAKSYAVLLVPGMRPGATTTVVWIQDEPEDPSTEPGPATVQ